MVSHSRVLVDEQGFENIKRGRKRVWTFWHRGNKTSKSLYLELLVGWSLNVEWLFRRHFWIVHLVFLALCALILATSVNVIVGYELAKSFAVRPRKAVPRPPEAAKPKRDFSIANERNIFGAKRELVAPVDVDADDKNAGLSGRWEDAQPTSLRVRLVGTAVFLNPKYSLAQIEDLRQGPGGALSYSINDCPEQSTKIDPLLVDILGPSVLAPIVPCNRLVDVGVVKRIEPTRVYIYNEQDRRYEYLSMEEGIAPIMPAPVAVPVGSVGKVDGEYGKSVRKVGPTSFEIDSADLDSALGNLSEIATQARVVPAFENGKPIGFKMFSIRPGSVFAKIGLENGDVVTRINGYELNSPDKALELYQKLRTDKQVNIDVKKGGSSPVTYDYSILGK
jgi:general secretion pathway protein C